MTNTTRLRRRLDRLDALSEAAGDKHAAYMATKLAARAKLEALCRGEEPSSEEKARVAASWAAAPPGALERIRNILLARAHGVLDRQADEGGGSIHD